MLLRSLHWLRWPSCHGFDTKYHMEKDLKLEEEAMTWKVC